MKKKIFGVLAFIILTGTFFFLNNCKKTTEDDPTSVVQDNTLAEQTFADVKSISDQASSGSLQTFKVTDTYTGQTIESTVLGSCATITLDTISATRTITINFGTTDCPCNDGKYRKGKINVSYTGRYRDPGTVIKITFDGYYVNDNYVDNSSTKQITNNGRDSNGYLKYTIVDNAKIITSNSRTIIWSSTRTNEWIAGEKTLIWSDDEYLISGNATGINGNGKAWSINITKALDYKLSCRWITSGTVDIVITGRPTITLDYGSGACDDLATATYNGKVYNITLLK